MQTVFYIIWLNYHNMTSNENNCKVRQQEKKDIFSDLASI